MCSGFFIVPLYADLQDKSPENEKGRYIAFSNIISFGGILAASLLGIVLSNVNPVNFMIGVGIVTIVISILSAIFIADLILRVVIKEIVNTLYRIRSIHPENRRHHGVVLSNHLSYMDPFMVGSRFEKMLSYMMFRSFYEMPVASWFWRKLHCIPVSGGDSPEKKQQSLDIAHKQIESGHAVCIFPEGKLWRTGNLLPFKNGFERIVAGVDCHLIPTYIDGMWGSIFSYERKKYIFKMPKKFSDSINIIFGTPLPATTKAFEVRQVIQELAADAYKHRLKDPLPLHIQFIDVAKKNWSKTFIRTKSEEISFGDVLTQALSFSETIEEGTRVGIVLPTEQAIIANLAVLYKGAIPVNLKQDSSFSKKVSMLGIESCIALEPIENITSIIWKPQSNVALTLKSRKRMVSQFVKGDTTDCDQELTVFPIDDDRGAVVSHRNVFSNVCTFHRTFELENDSFLVQQNIYEPFSFTANFWLAALHAQQILLAPENNNDATIIFTNNAQGFTNTLQENHKIRYFGLVSDCANKELQDEFKEKYNIEVMYMLASPYCAPFVALNRPDFVDKANYNIQLGTREGSVGLPFPEVALRIVCPQTDAILGENEEGKILVKGANVCCQGVGFDLEKQDEWLEIGYRGRIDDKGFLHLVN